jgi:hypothetical protein
MIGMQHRRRAGVHGPGASELVHAIGMTRARVKIGMANLAYNVTRLAWLNGRTAPAQRRHPSARNSELAKAARCPGHWPENNNADPPGASPITAQTRLFEASIRSSGSSSHCSIGVLRLHRWLTQSAQIPNESTNGYRFGRAERSSPTATQRCAEGAGLEAGGATERQFWWGEMNSKNSLPRLPAAGSSRR